MTLIDSLGLVGMLLILISYLGLQLEYFSHSDLSYDLINLVGGGILTYYAYVSGTLPFVILNLVWTIVALKDIQSYICKRTCKK